MGTTPRTRISTLVAGVAAVLTAATVLVAPAVQAGGVDAYLNLPLVNRDAEASPGGVNGALPTDPDVLRGLLETARSRGLAPASYRALLFQFWLTEATQAAGIDLGSWDPRAGVKANRENLIRSYRYYEDLQLGHRELQWAGMGGQVGADFGGGLADFDLLTDVYDLPGLAATSRAVVGAVTDAAGPQALELLPAGLRALASAGDRITTEDLHYILGMILVMQKHIFSDLMPMHRAYVTQGLPALEEMERAGLFGADLMTAWRDIASKDPDRVARGNAALLQREQGVIIKDQWDTVRAYKGDVGEAVTYLSTVAGSPSVAGVTPPRSYRPVRVRAGLPDGRTVTVTSPLPSWNWSVYEQRWDYIAAELLPRYRAQVDGNWPTLEAQLRVPYETQFESKRPLLSIPQILESALANTKVEVS
ncbi:hypothetical protein [Rhodococcus kronopolitis]|uniref:Tat pathway signal protein n=1 Tax=Rhodococcus kronopolitis TaxID=1460226 RepID=A0ABV9FY47_9NOCA